MHLKEALHVPYMELGGRAMDLGRLHSLDTNTELCVCYQIQPKAADHVLPAPSRQLTQRLGKLILGCGRLPTDKEVAAEGFFQVLLKGPEHGSGLGVCHLRNVLVADEPHHD